jgi:hypothetical protein
VGASDLAELFDWIRVCPDEGVVRGRTAGARIGPEVWEKGMAHLMADREPPTGERILGAPLDHQLADASSRSDLGSYREPGNVPDIGDSGERCDELDVDWEISQSTESLNLIQ